MKLTTLLLSLCLGLAMALPGLADTTKPGDAYQASLPLYQYSKTQPLAIKTVGIKTFPECRMLRFSYASAHQQRVPALLFVPLTASKAHPVPCLALLHGMGQNIDSTIGLARYAAAQGYASLAIEEYGQGERALPEAQGKPLTADYWQRFLLTGVPQTVVDVRRGLDYLQTRPNIDHKRLGLVGFSLGAVLGAVAAGVDTRLKANVLVSGGGDWAVILKYLAAEARTVGGQQIAGTENVDWTFVSALLSPEDPITFAPHIAPRALLMMNGRKDTTIIPQAAEALYQAAQSAPGAQVQIDWLPDAGHIPPPELVYPVVQKWLTAHL